MLLLLASSAVLLKVCAITAGIKKYKLIIKWKKKNHDQIVLLEKAKLNTIEVLTSKSLIDSFIAHDEFFLVNNALREYNEMKEEIKSYVEHTHKYRWYKTYKRNGIEAIVDNRGILHLNENI